MKHRTTIIFILLSFTLFSQEESPLIETSIWEGFSFFAEVEEDPFIIDLEFKEIEINNEEIYLVQGWFSNENKNPIDRIIETPLIGFFVYPEMTLYHFKDTLKSQQFLNRIESNNLQWNDLSTFKSLEGFQDKLVFSPNGTFFLHQNKKSPISLVDPDLEISPISEQLTINPSLDFDLHTIDSWVSNLTIAAYNEDRVILHFSNRLLSSPSRPCESGHEKGFLILDYTKNKEELKYEKIVYESCRQSISLKKKESIREGLTTYHCYNYKKKKSFDLIVNLNELEIHKKKKKTLKK